jgi:hypothetical protein
MSGKKVGDPQTTQRLRNKEPVGQWLAQFNPNQLVGGRARSLFGAVVPPAGDRFRQPSVQLLSVRIVVGNAVPKEVRQLKGVCSQVIVFTSDYSLSVLG